MGSNAIDEPRWVGAREVMSMSWPIVLGSVSQTAMQFADQVMVAYLGTDALAAAGSAGVWSYTMGCLIFGTVGCVSTFAAQSLGRGEMQHCARYGWQGLYLSCAALVLTVLLWPVSRVFFDTMGHSARVTEFELTYFRIRLLGYAPMAWATALSSFFLAVGRPKIAMYSGIAANIVNIILNYILIFGHFGFPKLGIGGAAIATVVSQALQALVLMWVFLGREMNGRYGTRRSYAFDPVRMGELVRIGVPSGLTVLMDVANWGIFTSYVVGHFGSVQLAAHNAAVNFMHVAFMPALGLNQGIAAIVGRYVGSGDIVRAKARTYTAMKIAAAYMGLVGLCFGVFGATFMRLFSADPAVISLGHILLILAAMFQAFDALNIVTSGALRGAGDTRWMAYLMFFGAYLVFLPLAVVLAWPLGGGAVGAWIGATIYIVGISGFFVMRFRSERWRHIRVFATERPVG